MKKKKISKIPACNDCVFDNNSIFKQLTKNELDNLAYEKGCNLYKKGEIIYRERNPLNKIYCVSSGVVKLFKTGAEEKEQIIGFAQSGNIIGFRSVLSNDAACHTAKVIEDAVLCQISSDTLFQLIKENPSFAIELLKLTCKELDIANTFIKDIAQKSVRERLSEVLLILYRDFGNDENGFLNISLTREELSNIVGTATESIIRLLGELKNESIIEVEARKIKIINIKRLKELAKSP